MASEPKRRKIDEPLSHGILVSSNTKNDMATASSSGLSVSATQTGGIHFTIQQAKHFAATEARQDGCTGNYRMFDSPFGNFLVPVVPTRAELAQTENVKENLHVTMKMKAQAAQHQI